MERESELRNNMEMPKFCPECGGEFVSTVKVPEDIDTSGLTSKEIETLDEYLNVCTMCGYEENVDDDPPSLYNLLFKEEWQSINNALPDVTLPQKVNIRRRLRVLGHHLVPDEYLGFYSHLLLAELAAFKRP